MPMCFDNDTFLFPYIFLFVRKPKCYWSWKMQWMNQVEHFPSSCHLLDLFQNDNPDLQHLPCNSLLAADNTVLPIFSKHYFIVFVYLKFFVNIYIYWTSMLSCLSLLRFRGLSRTRIGYLRSWEAKKGRVEKFSWWSGVVGGYINNVP